MRTRMTKPIKIGGAALLLVLVIGGALTGIRAVIMRGTSQNTVYTVRSETYENVIEISGIVSAAQEQKLQALSTGTVMGVYVSRGDKVRKGDLIIQLDDTEQVYNLAKHDYDMATTRVSGTTRALSLMETQRLSLVQKINDRKVVATFDGIIADIDVAVGDSLEAKDAVGTLVDASYLLADVEIVETDVAKLRVGQKVSCTFPAYDGTVEGYVSGWPAIGEVTSRGATVVKARIRIDEYPEAILPNFSFSGTIEISPPETFLIVEREAVGRENGTAFVVNARTGEKIAVQVSPYGAGYVRIDSGVAAGDVLKANGSAGVSGLNQNRNRNAGMGGVGGPPPGGRR